MAPSVGVPKVPPGGPDWVSLVALWQLAGQALLLRLQSLEQIGTSSGSSSLDVAAYDVAVEEYLSQIRAAWLETWRRWPEAAPVAPPDFVESLIPDPGSPPEMVLFAGFQGRSTSEDQVRFYLDAELSSFVDVAREDVLYTRPLPPAQAPLGGYYVWARRDPGLLHTLETAAGRMSGTTASAFAAPWSGPPWVPAGNGDGAEAPASPFTDLDRFDSGVDPAPTAEFPDEEEEIPLPPGWPQPATL